MEVWLGTDNDKIRFPVTPQDKGINRSADISTETIINQGEVDISNGMKLKTSEISSFFPNRYYSFCAYKNFMGPWEFSEKIQKWMYNKQVLRFIVTGTPTNLLCKISDFNTNPEKGTGDVMFELSLLEHKDIDIPGLTDQVNRPVSNDSNGTQRTHRVIQGDNLWDLSQKYYGKGSIYKKINEANKNKYPSLAKNNIIYPNWILILP